MPPPWTWLKSGITSVFGGAGKMLSGIMPVGSSDPPQMGTAELLECYETMPWLQMAARKASDGVACALDLSVASIKRGGKTRPVKSLAYAAIATREKAVRSAAVAGELVYHDDHVLHDALDANPYFTRRALLGMTNTYLDIVGDAYWFVQRNALGKPAAYWPLPKHWVLESPTAARPTWRVGFRGWQQLLAETDILWFHDASVANPYARGAGLGAALSDDLEVDEYLAKMAKSMFFNQAKPDFVVYNFHGKTEKETAEKNWLRTHQGFWRTLRPHFMTGEPKFHEFKKPDMSELVYPELRARQRDIVLQVFGHPPEIFGILENSNRSTIDAANYIFQRFVVLPRCERIRETLQRHVAAEFDPRILLVYPNPIPEDKEFALKVATAMPQSMVMDEWRALQCLPAWGGDRGQAYAISVQHHMSTDLFAPPPPKTPATPPQKLAMHAHFPKQKHQINAPITVQPARTEVHVAAAETPDVNVNVQPAEVKAGDVHAIIQVKGPGPQDVEVVRDPKTREILGVKAVVRDADIQET